MSCCHPFKAFKTGYKTENGKDDYIIAFDDVSFDTLSLEKVKKPVKLSEVPYKVINGVVYLTDPVSIPCGSCVGCRQDKAREWKIRNCLEYLDSSEAYFITLTYDDRHLNHLKDENGEICLCKRDFQLFLKRLRKYMPPFRYFGCAEYGEHTKRPHFHYIHYGHLEGFRTAGVNKFTCPVIDKAWKQGYAIIEHVCPGNIAYVSGYVEKKYKEDLASYKVKPFLMMSNRPAIGSMYFERRKEHFKDDMHVYGHFSEGLKGDRAPVPKLFKRKLSDQEWFQVWKEAAIKSGKEKQRTQEIVYHTLSEDGLGDRIEASMNAKIERMKQRKESL